jgi:hypothetical protein
MQAAFRTKPKFQVLDVDTSKQFPDDDSTVTAAT